MNWRWLVVPVLALGLGAGGGNAAAQESDSAAVARAQTFIESLRAGDYAAAEQRVAPEVRDRLGAAQLRTVWNQLNAGLGALNGMRVRGVTPVDSLRAVELYGDFAIQTVLLRVVLSAASEVVGFWVGPVPPDVSAPVPAPPYADTARYHEEEVVVGEDPWRLPGTLTIPSSGTRFPAVVLVHGSGPHDRDESVGGAKVFRDLAWGLATQGIAVLRYEKRTKVHGAQMVGDITVEEEVIEDALAALALLRVHRSIDAARVYVLGHSLGGQLAPEIARRDGRVAGAILLAAPARPLDVLMIEQLEYIAALPANAAPEAQAQISTALEQVRRLSSAETPDTAVVLGASVAYFRDLTKRSGVAEAGRMDTPLLILQGERDYQVTMRDFEIWTNATRSRPATSLRSFPALNHLFVAGSGPATPAEYARPGFVSEEVVAAIATWVHATR